MSETHRSRRLFTPRVIISVLGLVAIVGIIAYLVLNRNNSNSANLSYDLTYPQRDSIVATVNASGQIKPAQVANLTFLSTGQVSEILVDVGDKVNTGDPLARVDSRELQFRAEQAEAALLQAQANYQKLAAGATPEEVAASEAQVRQAQAQLRQARGSVTQSDIAAAEAQLNQAQAQLSRLQGGPKAADVQLAQSQLDQAQANLQAQRDNLSANKTSSQLRLEQAANSLTQAQSAYSTAKQNWDYVQATGKDPVSPNRIDLSSPSGSSPNTLNDAQRQQYYNAFVQAEAALRNAEDAVEQAQVAYDNARQAEVSGVRVAEEQVKTAQTNLEKLLAGADTDQLAAAQAAVRSAQANLDKLRGDQRRGAIDAAQAAVDAAQSNLARIQSGASGDDLTIARAQVQSAQAAYDLAQLALEEATLRAPFAGTVSEINLQVGEVPAPNPAKVPMVLADLSSYHVDVAVDEIDIARLEVGQPVTLTLDALPDLQLPGTVESIAPLSTVQSAVTSYQVRITTQTNDPRVRSGLSASADIIVARKENALLVPRRAVRNERGTLIVEVPRDQSVCTVPRDERPAQLTLEQRPVQTGLSNDQSIEITSGLDEQTCISVPGIGARAEPLQPFRSNR